MCRTLWKCTRTAIVLSLLVLCCGCVELLSWSPDGKWVAFIDSDETLWLWDVQKQESKKIAEGAIGCRFMPSGHLVFEQKSGFEPVSLFGGRMTMSDNCEAWLQVLRPEDSSSYSTIADVVGLFGASRDGRYWYYARPDEVEKDQYVLWEYEHETNDKKQLLKTPGEILQMSGDATGSRVLYHCKPNSEEGVLSLYEKSAGTSKTVDSASGTSFCWPTWIDEQRVMAMKMYEEDENFGDLVLYDLASGDKRVLMEHIGITQAPDVSPDGKRVLVQVAKPNLPIDWYGSRQIACIDIENGSATIVTDEAFGANLARFRPTGNAIAYMTPAEVDNLPSVVVLDMDTKKRTFAWCNETQREFALAETMLDAGRKSEALSMYESLLERNLEREIADRSHYRVAEIAFSMDPPNLDKAYGAYRKVVLDNYKAQLHALLGGTPVATATDPAGDCLRSYSTEEGRKRFEVDTDTTRDLRGVSLWWSPDRLYIKVDYQSAYDVAGIGFADTIFLFDFDSPDSGLRSITPLVDWEGGAERQILFRHWFDSGASGQYDIKVLGEDGSTISQFVASGFGKAVYPVVRVEDARYDERTQGGALVLSFLRENLELPENADIHIQVCTAQGGVAEHLELERPREKPGSGKPECDIADVFGESNTRERIDADLKANEDNAEYRPVIKGYALVTRAPKL